MQYKRTAGAWFNDEMTCLLDRKRHNRTHKRGHDYDSATIPEPICNELIVYNYLYR